MLFRKALLLLFVVAPAPALYADVISGTVVDSLGVPVAGVNIVAESVFDGSDGNIANAGTDALGNFNATIIPGTYDFIFEPPAPPLAVALVTTIPAVTVLGLTSMGTVALDPAVSLHVRLIQATGQPVQFVNLDVIVAATGEKLDLIGDTSDALGEIDVAVPPGDFLIRMKPSEVIGPLYAPEELPLLLLSNGDMGDVVLKPGFFVSAALLDSGFAPVQNLDVDVVDTARGDELYTPGDNTDNNGLVNFVVPTGTFDFEFCPQLGDSLVAQRVAATPVSATVNLGIITLAAGAHLTGTISSHLGQPVANADIDARDTSTLLNVLLCGDNTNSAGDYDVVVPVGTLDLTFTPPDSAKLGSAFDNGVVIPGPTIRSAVLPFCDCGSPSGGGVAGSGGFVPTIAATGGGMRLGSHGWSFAVGQGLGGSIGIAGVGFGPACGSGLASTVTPIGGGISLVSNRVHARIFRLSGLRGAPGAGSAEVTFTIPLDFALTGTTLTAQVQITDPLAPSGRSLTPMLCGAVCQ